MAVELDSLMSVSERRMLSSKHSFGCFTPFPWHVEQSQQHLQEKTPSTTMQNRMPQEVVHYGHQTLQHLTSGTIFSLAIFWIRYLQFTETKLGTSCVSLNYDLAAIEQSEANRGCSYIINTVITAAGHKDAFKITTNFCLYHSLF